MTITTQILRKDYTANGSNTTFAVDFPIFYESNSTPKFSLEVITTDASGIETNKTETTDYTITYTTIENGIIPICNVVFNTAPINGHKVNILRKVNLTQNAEFTESGTEKYSGKAVESALDKLTLQTLQIQENLNRVVRLPKSSTLTNIEFPINASVADEVICINSAGDNLATKNLADVSLAPVSTYIKTLLDDTTASQARTTLDAQQLNSNLTALSGLTGASNKIPMFTGAGAMSLTDKINPATTTTQGIVYLNNPILLKNTTGNTNTKIDFQAGNAQLNDGSGQVVLSSTLTKILQSSGAWTAGNDANGLFSSARANNTWYYAFVIQNTTTGVVDAGFDSSPVGANVPSGWKITKLINCLRTDGSGNIMTGDYFPDGWFYWTSEQLEYSSSTSASTTYNLSYVPKEIPSMGHFTAVSVNNGTTGARDFRVGISSTNGRIIGGGISYGDGYSTKDGGQIPVKIVSSNPQVYISSTGTGTSILRVHGFKPLI